MEGLLSTSLVCTGIVFSGGDTAPPKALIVILRGANDTQKSPHVVLFAAGFHVLSRQIEINIILFS